MGVRARPCWGKVYSLQFTVYSLRFTVYSLQFTVYSLLINENNNLKTKNKKIMEIIAKITKIGAMNERQYTNRQTGQVETFRTVGVWLYRGGDVIYCEAVQENA